MGPSFSERLLEQATETWDSIADDSRRARVLTAVRAFGDQLVSADRVALKTTVSLASGTIGAALFLAYLSRECADETYARRARGLVEEFLVAAEDASLWGGWFSGIPGIVWGLDHTLRVLGDFGEQDSVADSALDDLIIRFASTEPWSGHYDLISGLAGFGLYALHRGGGKGEHLLGVVTKRLQAMSEQTAHGVAWRTPKKFVALMEETAFPNGDFNLGMAHGAPGVIAMLAEACRRGARNPLVEELLEGSVSWLLSLQKPNAETGYGYLAGKPLPAARAAWCYGDPGVAAALFRAAAGMGRKDWFDAAQFVSRRVVSRPWHTTGVFESNLCHGSSGLTHFLNTAYQITRNAVFRKAALEMADRTLSIMEKEADPQKPADPQLPNMKTSFLNGFPGTCLALLAVTSATQPGWDYPFMIGIHPVTALARLS